MVSKQGGIPQNSRPALSTQQSNSVPSTPHQRPHRGFGASSRSPSPRGLSGSHSPRSVVSEVHSSALPKGSPRCKYEGKKPSTKRRMQYNIGDALLDDPPVKPKESLDPDEEKKLSGDMRELYDRLLPTEDSEKRRRLFVEKLERILRKEWPQSEFRVHVFGSSGNLLCTNDSDVDICIQTNMTQLETMHILASALDNTGMERVICVPAKVPIVKIWDPEFKLAADLNVNNTLALENTRMIKTYVQIDERVRPLAMIIKHWTRQRILNDAGLGGTISSYAWICMILNFLQTRKPPILPSLHSRLQSNGEHEKNEYCFDDNLEKLRGFGKQNKQSIGELLFQFFRYYGYEFKYLESVVSVRSGRVLTRKEKGWTTTSKDGQWRLCIEEPFSTSRNLGNSADNTAFRGLHLEIRDAFTHLTNLKLEKLAEQYEFPLEEKSSVPIFKRAPGAPIPILPAQASGRGKGGGRNRHNRGNHSGPSSRRASSGSAYGKNNHTAFSPSPMGISAEFFNPQVAQQWATMLSFQAGQLKAQMYNNQIAQSQLAAAASHAQSVVQGGGSQGRDLNHASLANQRMFPNNMSLEQIMNGNNLFQPAFYPGTTDQAPPMTHSVSQDGSRTNPSSPSLAAAVPARRGMQRNSVSNGSPGASVRSHSQPARGLPQNLVVPYPMVFDPNTGLPLFATTGVDNLPAYQTADNQTGYAAMPRARYNPQDPAAKEYLGYYVEKNTGQQMPASSQSMQIPRPTSQTDLAQRRDKGPRDLQPLNLNGNKKSSRSPSPLGHQRHYSIPLRSAPLLSGPSSRIGSSLAGSQSIDQMQSPTSGSISSMNPLNGLYIQNDAFPSPPDSERIGQYPPSASDETPPTYFDPNDPVFSDDGSVPNYPNMYHVEYHHELDTMDPHSGLYLQNVPTDANGVASLGSPIQPFPLYNEPGMSPMPSLAPQEEEVVHSPTRQHQSIWQSFSPSGKVLSPTKDGKEKTPGSRSVPILSPVMETRTPSPSARRKVENFPPPIVNGNLVNGHVPNGVMSYRPAEPLPPRPLPMATSANSAGPSKSDANHGPRQHNQSTATGAPSSATPGQWQQQSSSKKRASRKRSKSGPATRSANESQAHKGQPMPAKVEDRKGG